MYELHYTDQYGYGHAQRRTGQWGGAVLNLHASRGVLPGKHTSFGRCISLAPPAPVGGVVHGLGFDALVFSGIASDPRSSSIPLVSDSMIVSILEITPTLANRAGFGSVGKESLGKAFSVSFLIDVLDDCDVDGVSTGSGKERRESISSENMSAL